MIWAKFSKFLKNLYMKAVPGIINRWGGALVTLHKARTDQPIDILQEKTLRKCDDCVGEKILSRFRPSTLFLYGNF